MWSKEQRKFYTFKPLMYVLLLSATSWMAAGCTLEEPVEEAEAYVEPTDEVKKSVEPANEQVDARVESAEKAIQTVITEMFTAPNEELSQLQQRADELYESDPYTNEEEYKAFIASPERQAIDSYMKETYAPYFTADGYEDQLAAGFYPFFFLIGSDGEGQVSVRSIEINQSDRPTAENNFYFSFMVDYTDAAGIHDQYKFTGMAIVPEKGKIRKMQFTDEEGFLEQVRQDHN